MRIFYFIALCFLILSCSDYDYYKNVKRGLESGVRNDSLFLGYYLGMSKQDFYDHSWELNKKHLVKQGQFNQSVEYIIEDSDKKIQMNFYPSFENDVIAHMSAIFRYTSWAPWDKKLWSDKLILELRNLLGNWHDVEFKLTRDNNGTPGFVSVTGNRRILITLADDQKVNVLYTDLTAIDNPLDTLVLNKIYE